MPDDLREALESSFDAHSEPAEAAASAPAQPAAPVAADTSSDGSANDAPHDTERARDATGRFAKGEAATPGKSAAAVTTAPTDSQTPDKPATQADLYAKAPQSWKPGAREAWGALPSQVREEIHRRERDTARLAQESATHKDVFGAIQRLQTQFSPALQAEGVDALTASANLMQLASRLRFGTPVEKAQLAAQIIQNYGVDVTALAAALDGARMPANLQSPMMADPRVDKLLAEIESAKRERAASIEQRALSDVSAFGENKEFFEDVREDMADLLELSARRGVDLSLDQAYQRACAMSPDIAKVLAAREAAASAGNASTSIQRSKSAASSVRGTPASASTPAPRDLRGDIEAAIEQVGGR